MKQHLIKVRANNRGIHVFVRLFQQVTAPWLDTSITICPPNMEYGNCTCQATCEDPVGRNCSATCIEEQTCICVDGFLRKGDDCVPLQECSCFVEERVIPVS